MSRNQTYPLLREERSCSFYTNSPWPDGIYQYCGQHRLKAYEPHTCSPQCIIDSDLDFISGLSGLMQPIVQYWSRYLYTEQPLIERDFSVAYIAPCGFPIVDEEDLAKYLDQTRSKLSICCFTFDPSICVTKLFVTDYRTTKINDVALGRELNPVEVVNSINEKDIDGFKYIAETEFSDEDFNNDSDEYCRCVTCGIDCECIHETIANSQYTVGGFPYVHNRLSKRIGSGIYECNDNCLCVTNCGNRVAQYPSTQLLQIYRTWEKDWGVRTLTDVPKGSFICVYTGVVIGPEEISKKSKNLVDSMYMCTLDVVPQRYYLATQEKNHEDVKKTNALMDERAWRSIDAKYKGNVARFINHSCDPNCFAQHVFTKTRFVRTPELALFAKTNIHAGEELTYDYGPEFGNLHEKEAPCLCDAVNCKKILNKRVKKKKN